MPKNALSFIDQCLSGDAIIDEIEDFIGAWHDGSSELSLHEYLGMLRDEYELFLNSPESLPLIVASRKTGDPVARYVNDNVMTKLAARSAEPNKIRRLQAWLDNRAARA